MKNQSLNHSTPLKNSAAWMQHLQHLAREFNEAESALRKNPYNEEARKKLISVGALIKNNFADPLSRDKKYEKYPVIRRIFISYLLHNIEALFIYLFSHNKKLSWWHEAQMVWESANGCKILLGSAPTEAQIKKVKKTLIVSFQTPWEVYDSHGRVVRTNFGGGRLITGATPNIAHLNSLEQALQTDVYNVARFNFPLFDHTFIDSSTGELVRFEKILSFLAKIREIIHSNKYDNILFHCWSGKERSVAMAILLCFMLEEGRQSLVAIAKNITTIRTVALKLNDFKCDVLLVIAEVFLQLLNQPEFKRQYQKLSYTEQREDLNALFTTLEQQQKNIASTYGTGSVIYQRLENLLQTQQKNHALQISRNANTSLE